MVQTTEPRRVARRRAPIVLAALAVLVAALLAGHRLVPQARGVGTVLDSFLPWFGLLILPIAAGALIARSRIALATTLVPALVWSALFVPDLAWGSGGDGDLRVVSQNLGAGNREVPSAANALAGTGADLIGVQELTGTSRELVAEALQPSHPYAERAGTVGLWSRYPLAGAEPVDLGMPWPRAMRARVRAPQGDLTVYVVHLASIRLGAAERRDRSLARLAEVLRADTADRVVVLGDLNTASTDREFDSLTGILHEAKSGFGFTWPAGFPLTRPDHILYRGLAFGDGSVLAANGSDHRAIQAVLRGTTGSSSK
ncbi:endonuclease/exonuclease/phosphatase family protein [Amycolatopsis anabasis]|uniref:endonuclease/exonuclease/phosphatase family protein n=1 Tax=Amycolatopsis anabasis TaxID=1840409 RepID=UPI00131E47B0|nr:endonuclease/exonuclease/phosphatase family protein [Amycolatopsis anabasis]